MKKLILTFIILIAVYTLLRNNVFKIPDQIIWSTNYNVFYKMFLPFLMFISAIVSLFRSSKHAYFNLAIGAMVLDTINRLAIGVNHLYGYFEFKDIPIPPVRPDTVRIVTNYWPSHIMLFIEIILIIMILLFYKDFKLLNVETNS